MKNGAKFYKCDFQIHTPRDEQFKGKEYITDDERKDYADKFIKACRIHELDAVAITDHHDLWFFKYIKEASKSEYNDKGELIPEDQQLIVFPGIELTLGVPCQALLLFDADLDVNDELIIQLYAKLGINDYTSRENSKTVPTSRLSIDSFPKLTNLLDDLKSIKGRYIILPNVKESGDFTILRTGFHQKYKDGNFVGGYLDGNTYNKHIQKPGWSNIINGKTLAYGTRPISVFQTSDCRSDNFDLLGSAHTWIKFAEPTAEGIRQACIAKQSRISQTKPLVPTVYLEQLTVKGSAFFDEISVLFNSQLNVVIGGRGTGKSSILAYINYALGKKSESLSRFIAETLTSGTVELTIVKENVSYILLRGKDNLELKIADNDFKKIDQVTVDKLFNVDSYSQKELSKHGGDRLLLINKIVDFSIQENLDRIFVELSNNAADCKEAFLKTQRHEEQSIQMESLLNQKISNEKQILELKNQLINVSASDKEAIETNSIISKEEEYVNKLRTTYSGIFEALNGYAENSLFNTQGEFDENFINKTEIGRIKSLIDVKINKIKSILLQLANEIDFDSVDILMNNLNLRHIEQKADYEQAKERLAVNKVILQQIEVYEKTLSLQQQQISKLNEMMLDNAGSRIKLYRLLLTRYRLFDEVFDERKKEAEKLSTKLEGCLDIVYVDNMKISSFVDKFMSKVKSSKNQDERTRAYFMSIVKTSQNDFRKKLVKFFYSIILNKRDINIKIEDKLTIFGIPNNDLLTTDFERIINSLSENDVLDLALEPLSYRVNMNYYREKGISIPFKNASYGQQAGAIINILLNQTHGPLIIDQPEDDLDNKVVHQITERINATKQNRQLIFASHNANIAVNGDAELIVHFEYNPDKMLGEVSTSGAIDSDAIKTSIKDIMEGGELALKMRFDKYGF